MFSVFVYRLDTHRRICNKPVEFIPGMKLKFCGNCGSTKVVEIETEIKCPDCGMGKHKGGR